MSGVYPQTVEDIADKDVSETFVVLPIDRMRLAQSGPGTIDEQTAIAWQMLHKGRPCGPGVRAAMYEQHRYAILRSCEKDTRG